MYTKTTFLAIMAIVMMPFMAMAQTDVATQNIPVQSFSAIHSSGSAHVELSKSDAYNVSVTDHPKNLPYVEVSSENGVLHISHKKGYNARLGTTKVLVQIPEVLNSIRISGSGELSSKDHWKLQNMRVSLAGSGNVELEGTAQSLSLTVAGSGSIRLPKMVAESAKIALSGSGVISVHATKSLKADLAGSGNIVYFGNPPVFDQSVSGSGRIRKA
jgi:hypothetical protein